MLRIDSGIYYTNDVILKFVIQGMRNPMNSWEKSDSNSGEIGAHDIDLMTKLMSAGPEHRKFLRQMPLYLRITAPLYWWKEFDTYKVGTVANSCSTMHKIAEKPFTVEDFSIEHLNEYNKAAIRIVIEQLNYSRDVYLETKKKEDWWQMIQLLPSSYNQTRNVSLNMEVALTIVKQRCGHKLDEWGVLVKEFKRIFDTYGLKIE